MYNMVMQNKLLIINSQYPSNLHANKQLVYSENWNLNESVNLVFVCVCVVSDLHNVIFLRFTSKLSNMNHYFTFFLVSQS